MRHGFRPRLTPTLEPDNWRCAERQDWLGADDDDWNDDADRPLDEFEDALADCGRLPESLGGGCLSAGSEYCDFDCPFRDGL